MTILKSAFIILFSIFFCLKGFTQTTKTIDSLKSIDQACLDSGWRMPSCEYEYLIAIDSILNVVYNKLHSKLDSSGRTALKKEQLDWLKQRDIHYKKSDKEFEDSIRAGSWGDEMRVVTIGEKSDFTEKRVLVLIQRLDNKKHSLQH